MSKTHRIGILGVLVLVLLICADSFGRSFFSMPIEGVVEVVAVSMAVIVFCQLADTVRLGRVTRSDYSHLSQIAVKAGERVAKETILGHTGSSGLAGGDHLHFSVLVHHLFVDPIDWWDAHWIQDNITLKVDSVRGASGQAG